MVVLEILLKLEVNPNEPFWHQTLVVIFEKQGLNTPLLLVLKNFIKFSHSLEYIQTIQPLTKIKL
jgi:hypothetical protein